MKRVVVAASLLGFEEASQATTGAIVAKLLPFQAFGLFVPPTLTTAHQVRVSSAEGDCDIEL